MQKKTVESVGLKVTDATGKVVREISGQALANSKKVGMQMACWDLRVDPAPTPRGAFGGGGPGGGQGSPGGAAGGGQAAQTPSPFGAGCPSATGGFGGGFGAGAATAGPFVLPGTYTVALVIDGKSVDTKTIRVSADPDVALTAVERKKMFDMAMEIHALQGRATEAVNAFAPFNTRMTELGKEIAAKKDLPADVKAAFDGLAKDVAAIAPKFTAPVLRGGPGGGGFGQQGPTDYVVTKLGQAKTSLMGGMWPTQAALTAYADAKAQVPKAIADLNALFTKAAGVSRLLEAQKLTLKVPEAVK
jgi:hypothetical protein